MVIQAVCKIGPRWGREGGCKYELADLERGGRGGGHHHQAKTGSKLEQGEFSTTLIIL